MKEKIRPIYSELQGYLSQAPEATSGRERIYDDTSLVNQLNSSIQELEQLTQKDYSRYKERVQTTMWNRGTRQFFDLLSYRSKLGGLISRLHGEYFSGEPAPFSGMPSTVINQHQSQNQKVDVSVVINIDQTIQTIIDKIKAGEPDEQKVKEAEEKLNELKDEVKKENPQWSTIKKILEWALNFGRDVFIQVLPILLEKYGK